MMDFVHAQSTTLKLSSKQLHGVQPRGAVNLQTMPIVPKHYTEKPYQLRQASSLNLYLKKKHSARPIVFKKVITWFSFIKQSTLQWFI